MKRVLLRVVYNLVRVISDAVGLGNAGSARSAKVIASNRIDLPRVGLRPRYELGYLGAAYLVADRYDQLALGVVCSTLGEDLDHSVRGVRSVKRRCCGALYDLNSFDVFRVDVGESEVANCAIDDHQRILRTGEARCGAQPDCGRRTRLSRGVQDGYARDLSSQSAKRSH